jgi:TetR/AcrR family transcriptional regulator
MVRGAREPSARSEATRASILKNAERLFAETGFDKTRLEDIAEAVGIRRASIVYYYRDKAEVYDAVLEGVFGNFRERLDAAFKTRGTLHERIEAAIAAWVDYVGERPSFARILLREIANGTAGVDSAAAPHVLPYLPLVQAFIEDNKDQMDELRSIAPAHVAATIAGATIFFVAGLPVLVGTTAGFDPLSSEHMAAHREEVLRIARRLLREKNGD